MILKKKLLTDTIDRLAEGYQVYAPVDQGSYSLFKRIRSGSEAQFKYLNSKVPPKGILFPQHEKLFSYKVTDAGVGLEENLDDKKKVIFGVRPCDAKSLTLLDNVFINDSYEDPYYALRRANTVLVGMSCTSPAGACFCTSMGSGPADREGLDLLLTDLGEAYYVYVLSEKGRELAAGWQLEEAGDSDKEAAQLVEEQAKVACRVETAGLKEKLDVNYDDPVWSRIHEKCLGCAACTYLCPTCHCFDIVDEAVDNNGSRVRNWDSCMFPLFTLHGSGHNPRPGGKERMRQRIMHKFRYFKDNFGATACVGCGRCIKNCPVNLDIRQVLAEILGPEARGSKE